MKRILFIILSSVAIFVVKSSVADAQITVGPNVHVSRARTDVTHVEVLMAAHPNNPQKLLGCTIIGPTSDNRSQTGVYGSFDGGASWSPVITYTDQMQSMDPACTYGINDRAYFATLSRNKDLTLRLNAYYSEDAGKTWQESIIPAGVKYNVDREYVTVDTSRSSKYRGRVYVHGFLLRGYGLNNATSMGGFRLYRSLDGGKTFELPIDRLLADRTTVLHVGNGVVLSDGMFVALFAQLTLDKRNDGYPNSDPAPASRPSGAIRIITSSDGGDSLNQEVQVSDIYGDWGRESSTIPSLSADTYSDVFRDRLYAVWADGRFGGRTQIVLSYSVDKGKTWSRPRLVSDDRAPVHGNLQRPTALPVVAVNKDGVVGVLWTDRRESSNDSDYHVRFAASMDGGETFTPSVRVSEKPNIFDEPNFGVIKGVSQASKDGPSHLILVREKWLRGGDTAGLTADANGTFHPLWIDNRTGIAQVWTAPIVVKGIVARNGDQSLEKLDDVTSKIDLDVVGASYDRTTNEGTLNIRLKNISRDPIVGPIKLRALMVTSELGIAHILNADNGGTTDGAIWDFTSLLENNMLPPDGTSGVKSLKFRITNLRPFRQPNGSYKWIFADVNAIVLGKIQRTESMTPGLPDTPEL